MQFHSRPCAYPPTPLPVRVLYPRCACAHVNYLPLHAEIQDADDDTAAAWRILIEAIGMYNDDCQSAQLGEAANSLECAYDQDACLSSAITATIKQDDGE